MNYNINEKSIEINFYYKAMLFVIAVSDYDRVLEEDPRSNRMVESVKLFKAVMAVKYIAQATKVVFLNKVDIFKKKIKIR